MKLLVLACLLFCSPIVVLTQDRPLPKFPPEERQSLYDNCMNMVDDITSVQKNELCRCVLHKVENEYSPEQFKSLLRPEYFQLIKGTIDDCSVNIYLNERSLLGMWRFKDYSIWFKRNDNFTIRYDDGVFGGGAWQLAGHVLNFSRNHNRIKVIYYDENTLKFIMQPDLRTVQKAVRMSGSVFTRPDLVGIWRNRTSSLELNRNGTFRQEYFGPTEILTGKWEFDSRTKGLQVYVTEVNHKPVRNYSIDRTVLDFDGIQLRLSFRGDIEAFYRERQ